jgi:hypothetical protein
MVLKKAEKLIKNTYNFPFLKSSNILIYKKLIKKKLKQTPLTVYLANGVSFMGCNGPWSPTDLPGLSLDYGITSLVK